MSLDDLLLKVLACPRDTGALERTAEGYACTVCGTRFPVAGAAIHFLAEEDVRPRASVGIGRQPELQSMALYERNAANNRQTDAEHPATVAMLRAVAESGPVIVDLASGPGGGYLASLLDMVPSGTVVLGTDACVPVVKHQAELFSREHGDRFRMLDTDLEKRFPFHDGSVGSFTGGGIDNIECAAFTFRECLRCLKPGGLMAIEQRFYAEGSESASYLSSEGNIFASWKCLRSYVESIGFTVDACEDLWIRVGKSDPKDGMPLCDTDEWTWSQVRLRKPATTKPCA